jgi:hypothetical protein
LKTGGTLPARSRRQPVANDREIREHTRPQGYPHTTHKRDLKKIEYRHHPFYGTDVQVVGVLRRFQEVIDLVLLPDGSRLAVPRWMLDSLICSQLPQRATPCVAPTAVSRLAALIDRHGLSAGAPASDSGPSTLTKGIHVPREKHSVLSTVHPGLGGERKPGVGTVAAGPTSALPPNIGAVVKPGSPARKPTPESRA